jgi:hypothetical protein
MTSNSAGLPSQPPATPVPDQRLVAKTPEDVLAAVNVVLGFEPQSSAVMLTFGGAESFHARVDLPTDDSDDELDDLVGQLLEPALSHRVQSVVFVLFSGDEVAARRCGRRLTRRFERSGIRVVEVIRAHDRRWYSPGRPGVPGWGVPYDVSSHPFTVQSVLDGQVIHASREQLAALLHGPRAGIASVERARRRAVPLSPAGVATGVLRALSERRIDDAALASMLLGLLDLDGRDAAWADLDRSTAPGHVELWTNVVQRSPDDLVAAPAAVLALAAWLAGHGALAWCAVDRCQAVEPENSLARLVSDVLVAAVPPSCWERLWAESRAEDAGPRGEDRSGIRMRSYPRGRAGS